MRWKVRWLENLLGHQSTTLEQSTNPIQTEHKPDTTEHKSNTNRAPIRTDYKSDTRRAQIQHKSKSKVGQLLYFWRKNSKLQSLNLDRIILRNIEIDRPLFLAFPFLFVKHHRFLSGFRVSICPWSPPGRRLWIKSGEILVRDELPEKSANKMEMVRTDTHQTLSQRTSIVMNFEYQFETHIFSRSLPIEFREAANLRFRLKPGWSSVFGVAWGVLFNGKRQPLGVGQPLD